MSAQVIPFDFEETSVRAVLRDGVSWWVAADVCRVLEIGNSRQALVRLDEDEKGVITIDTLGGPQEMRTINESGLYALILTSRKPAARRFRKWVTAEVLPALRREGRYGLPSKDAKQEIAASRLIELLEAENELLRQQAGKKRARRTAIPTTDEERAEIKRLIEAGHSVSQISRMTGRSNSMISFIRRGMRMVDGGDV